MAKNRRLLFLVVVSVLAVIAFLQTPEPAWSFLECPFCKSICSNTQCFCPELQRMTTCGFCNCIQ